MPTETVFVTEPESSELEPPPVTSAKIDAEEPLAASLGTVNVAVTVPGEPALSVNSSEPELDNQEESKNTANVSMPFPIFVTVYVTSNESPGDKAESVLLLKTIETPYVCSAVVRAVALALPEVKVIVSLSP